MAAGAGGRRRTGGARRRRWCHRTGPGARGGACRSQAPAHVGERDETEPEEEREECGEEHPADRGGAGTRLLNVRGLRDGARSEPPAAAGGSDGARGPQAGRGPPCTRRPHRACREGGHGGRPATDLRSGGPVFGVMNARRRAGAAAGRALPQQAQRAPLEPPLADVAHAQDPRRGGRAAGRTVQSDPQRQEAACPVWKVVQAAAQASDQTAQTAILAGGGKTPGAGSLSRRTVRWPGARSAAALGGAEGGRRRAAGCTHLGSGGR